MSAADCEEFYRWARSRNVGCMFARAMFSMPEHYGIHTIDLTDSDGGEGLQAATEGAIERGLNEHDVEGLVLILPRALPLLELASMLKRLAAKQSWWLREEPVSWQQQQYMIVGIDVYVGDDNGHPVLSEMVAFGPYDHLPPTRQTTLPVLTLRTKPRFSLEPLAGRTERRGNLAAIPIDIPSHAFDTMWRRSHELREELDGADNPLVRARVTLAFPEAVWREAQNLSK